MGEVNASCREVLEKEAEQNAFASMDNAIFLKNRDLFIATLTLV